MSEFSLVLCLYVDKNINPSKFFVLGKYKWDDGHVSGTVYHGGQDLTRTLTKVCLWI